MRKQVRGRRRHAFAGIDRFGYSCLASCTCGWASDLHVSEDRAFIAYGAHVAQGWVPRRRVRP
jgi:hypothetical protein